MSTGRIFTRKIFEITGLSSQPLNKQIRSLEKIWTHYKVTLDRKNGRLLVQKPIFGFFITHFTLKKNNRIKSMNSYHRTVHFKLFQSSSLIGESRAMGENLFVADKTRRLFARVSSNGWFRSEVVAKV